jgi:broad specificity phosphatase PhoE
VKEKMVALVSRHGQTVLNKQKAFRSWQDPDLDDTGVSQAHAAAKFMKDYPIRQVVCSPLLRAFVTATIQGAPHKITPTQHRGLFPWHLGMFAGENREDNNAALNIFVQNPKISIPKGESLEHFEDRQFAFWDAALTMARKIGLTLFVAHTSNVVCLEKFTVEEEKGRTLIPEDSETVKPGGVCAVYWNGKTHRIEPIFGQPEQAKFGGS